MRKVILVISALVLAALIGGGIAYASIPSSDGVVHGCYKNSNPAQGSLIAIDSAASCPTGFTALNWRQVDPLVVTSSVALSFDGGGLNGTSVACPTGRLATGGGAFASTAAPLVLTSTLPLSTPTPNGWQAIWRNTSPDPLVNVEVAIYAVCTGG